MKKNDILKGVCVDYTHDGLGIVKSENFTFFIQHVLMNEEIEFVITKLNKNYGFGKCLKILKESIHRTQPKCPYFKRCGGCQIQHMDNHEQLLFKTNIVKNNMKNIAHIDIEVKETLPSKNTNYYRNKTQIPVSLKDGKVEIGFYRIHSNDIIDMSHCLIQSEKINDVMAYIKEELFKVYEEDVLKHILIKHAFATDEMMIVLIAKHKEIPYLNTLVDAIVNQFTYIKSVILNINERKDNVILGEKEYLLYGESKIIDMLDDLSFSISSKSFYQVNPIQTKILYQTALNMANINKNDTIVDLYCGVGTISLFLARNAKKVIGIEIVEAAIEDAKKNAEINQIENVEFVCSDAGEYATYLAKKKEIVDVVVVDPPRKGCDQTTLNAIDQISPNKVVYISCNPATLARDLAYFKKINYECEIVQPVDMFPNTYHIESIVKLVRNK